MASVKEKISVLEEMGSASLDYSKISEYLQYAEDKSFAVPLLKSACARLVELDTRIAAAYEFLSEEEWNLVNHLSKICQEEEETLSEEERAFLEEHEDVVSYVKALCASYDQFCQRVSELDIEVSLRILAPIFKNRTKNVQFVLFRIAKKSLRPALGFLLNRTKKEPRTYAPYLASLIVRMEMDVQLRSRCVGLYFAFLKTQRMCDTSEFLILAQFFLYILCFDRELFFSDGVKAWIDELFASDIPSRMNRDVVERFISLFEHMCLRPTTPSSVEESSEKADDGRRKENESSENVRNSEMSQNTVAYSVRVFKPRECDALYYFPFDRPVCPSINDTVEDYVEFQT